MSGANVELWTEAERMKASDFDLEALEFSAAKESITRHVASSLGRRAIAELTPLSDEEVARMRSVFSELAERLKQGETLSLGGLTDPARILASAREGGFEEEELAKLRGFCDACERLSQWCKRGSSGSPSLDQLGRELPDLAGLLERLRRSVDERGRVLDEASPLLARLRVEERELSRLIDAKLRSIAREPKLRSALTDGRVHLRNGRLCLALKAKSS